MALPLPPPPIGRPGDMVGNVNCVQLLGKNPPVYGIDEGAYRTAAGVNYRQLRIDRDGSPQMIYKQPHELQSVAQNLCAGIPRVGLARQNAFPLGGRRKSKRRRVPRRSKTMRKKY